MVTSKAPYSSFFYRATVVLSLSLLLSAAGAVDMFPPGKWTTRGYGYAVLSTDGVVDTAPVTTALEETSISCIRNDDVLDAIVQVVVNDNETLSVYTSGSAAPYVMDASITDFAYGCANGTITLVNGEEGYVRSPLRDFDILVTTFAEHYAFFEQRNLTWATMAAEARTLLTDDSTDQELFDAIVSLMEPLNDGHVQLIGPNGDFYTSKPLEIVSRLQREFNEQTEYDDFETFQNVLIGTWLEIINGYMDDNGLEGDIDTFLYGKFADANVGYMMMQGFSAQEDGADGDEEAYLQALDDAFATLKSTDALVFDIRVNTGGEDGISLKVASYFAEKMTKAFTKKAWDRNADGGFTEAFEVFVEPTTTVNSYGGDVVLIVSGSTVSAAEIFTLSMAQLPQVTLLGRPTSGEFSDILGRQLPNGWLFGLSNEVYAAPDGTEYEIVGIPPAIEPPADLLTLDELRSGQDSWLDAAFALANTTVSAPGRDIQMPDGGTSASRAHSRMTTNFLFAVGAVGMDAFM